MNEILIKMDAKWPENDMDSMTIITLWSDVKKARKNISELNDKITFAVLTLEILRHIILYH